MGDDVTPPGRWSYVRPMATSNCLGELNSSGIYSLDPVVACYFRCRRSICDEAKGTSPGCTVYDIIPYHGGAALLQPWQWMRVERNWGSDGLLRYDRKGGITDLLLLYFSFLKYYFIVTLLVISYGLIYDIRSSVIFSANRYSHSTVERKQCT